MTLLAGSRWMLRRPPFVIPVIAAVVLVTCSVPILDDGWAMQVLRGVAVLVACAAAATTDDPCGEVLAASPYPRPVRSAARFVVGCAVLLPLWLVALVVSHLRDEGIPMIGLSLEAVGLIGLGLAVGAVMRANRDIHQPSGYALPTLLAVTLALHQLPAGWRMMTDQTWGPPWEAGQIRWAAFLLGCLGVVVIAWRDPLERPGREPPRLTRASTS
jgi:hypothetical protein